MWRLVFNICFKMYAVLMQILCIRECNCFELICKGESTTKCSTLQYSLIPLKQSAVPYNRV